MGRRRIFNDRLYSDHTVRKAIAYGPQSVVADIISKGLVKIYAELEPEVWVHAMIHDALVLSFEEEKIDKLLPSVLNLMTFPVEIEGRQMIIPVDADVGHNWGKYKGAETGETNLKGLRPYDLLIQ